MPERKRTRRPLRLPQRVEQAFELPDGTVSKLARIELCGDRRIILEGCRGIAAYEEDTIVLRTDSGTIRFRGRDLVITCFTCDEAVITGQILSLEFV